MAILEAVLNPPALILLLSPTLRQSGELFRDKVKPIYNALGRPVKVTQDSALSMELANGSRIISLPGDEQNIRGYSGVRLLVIDEAARVEDDLYRSVRPMLAVSGGRLICMTTPFGKNGWFYHEWQGGGDWERVRIPASQCPRIPKEFLAEELRSMGEQWYAQEYGCEFIDGAGEPLFPGPWLDRAESLAVNLKGKARHAKAIGIDPAEGGDKTAMAAVDEFGLIELVSKKTPDTSVVTGECLAFMRKHNVPADRVCFDRGGGGKEHADRLRSQGYSVRTVAFGETVAAEPRRGLVMFEERKNVREERYAYKNRRAEMYGSLRVLLDPINQTGFALPSEYTELRRQLAPIPMMYDGEGRLELPPKNKREGNRKTLVELIGHSPDEADALVIAVWAMQNKAQRPKVTVG